MFASNVSSNTQDIALPFRHLKSPRDAFLTDLKVYTHRSRDELMLQSKKDIETFESLFEFTGKLQPSTPASQNVAQHTLSPPTVLHKTSPPQAEKIQSGTQKHDLYTDPWSPPDEGGDRSVKLRSSSAAAIPGVASPLNARARALYDYGGQEEDEVSQVFVFLRYIVTPFILKNWNAAQLSIKRDEVLQVIARHDDGWILVKVQLRHYL